MNKRVVVGMLVAGSALLSGCVVDPEITGGRVVVHDENTSVDVVFSDRDRRVIHDYYHGERRQYEERDRDRDRDREGDDDREHGKKNGHKKGLPPGLAKREQLPPGLQRQVQRNGVLPPGLEGRRLPADLERQLAPLPRDYVRLQVGTDMVIMNSRTRVTVDVIKDMFQ